MKTDELNLTIDELDKLCRLYMDCELSVLEEKELEYVLSRTNLSSPAIDDVRDIMKIDVSGHSHPETVVPRVSRRWKYISRIAASVTVALSIALFFNPSDNNPATYIEAYSHGKQLDGEEAVLSTGIAMAKADSLMNLAASAERENMLKAEDIITRTFPN